MTPVFMSAVATSEGDPLSVNATAKVVTQKTPTKATTPLSKAREAPLRLFQIPWAS
jgi:hypothetical protein